MPCALVTTPTIAHGTNGRYPDGRMPCAPTRGGRLCPTECVPSQVRIVAWTREFNNQSPRPEDGAAHDRANRNLWPRKILTPVPCLC